ncbi:MAG: 4-alpha-glucanotransferase [Eubacteriales bacterium]
MRRSGVLLPITSIPSKYGIGCMSQEAYDFIDQLKMAGQHYWQILPIGPTGAGDSPYQSFSTFAGNPYFIDLEALVKQELLTVEECENTAYGDNEQYIDYDKIFLARKKLLHLAYSRVVLEELEGFSEFCGGEHEWLEDYALYMATKDYFEGQCFIEWDEDIRLRTQEAIISYREKLQMEMGFYRYIQYEFFKQWKKLKAYANEQGIQIVGDIPIYVAFDSADTWSHPALFQFDEDGLPTGVAGCPPDGFSATGQLWGNPLYNWEYHKKTGYDWWVRRIAHCYRLYDMLRVDHFRGFDEYYAIPYGDETAEFGAWEKGPGYDIFRVLKERLGEQAVIAEDLGFLTQSVLDLVEETGYPGMKVLHFAFDEQGDSSYLPHNYTQNCVVYTGTHDNTTTVGWFRAMSEKEREIVYKYLGVKKISEEEISWTINRMALSSVADVCIIPIQDYLGLGEEARINEPSTVGQNWKWRLLPGQIEEELLAKMKDMSVLYGRR